MELTKIKELQLALNEYQKADKKSKSMALKAMNARSRANTTSANANWGNASEIRDKCKEQCKRLVLEIFGEVNE